MNIYEAMHRDYLDYQYELNTAVKIPTEYKTMKKYRLKKDIASPLLSVSKNTIKTEREWISILNESLQRKHLDTQVLLVDTDWFEEVKEEEIKVMIQEAPGDLHLLRIAGLYDGDKAEQIKQEIEDALEERELLDSDLLWNIAYKLELECDNSPLKDKAIGTINQILAKRKGGRE